LIQKVSIFHIRKVIGKKAAIIVYYLQMRIIAGTKKGMKLASPKSDISRPILDRVKESLFSVLYKYDLIEDRRIADVFSGVGSLGLEALSRGARAVTFVEKDPKIFTLLKKNIEKAGFVEQSKVIKADAFKVAAPVGFEEEKYSIIFVDPPYSMTTETDQGTMLYELLILAHQQLADNGIIVVRTHRKTELLKRYGSLEILERRDWSSMAITLLRFRQEGND